MQLKSYRDKDTKFIHDLRNHPKIDMYSHPKELKIIWHGKERIGYIQRQRNVISIAIHPAYHGRGYGAKAISDFCKTGDQADILCDNISAMTAFKRGGFIFYAARFIKT